MSKKPDRFKSLRVLNQSRDFRTLCASQALAGLGEWLATLALIALVWDKTHSAIASGVVLAFRILPAALLGSWLGSLVDRLDRKRVLVACNAGRAVMYGALPIAGGLAPVLALALLAEVATIAYMSARDATLPRLIPREHLPMANAISMASAYGAMPIGSGLFALVTWIKPGVAFPMFLAAGIVGLATILVGRVNAHIDVVEATPDGCPAPEKTTFREGVRAIRALLKADPVLKRVAIGAAVAATGGGAVLTLGLAYVRGTLRAGPGAYGGLLTAFCAGVLVGVAGLQRNRQHLHKLFHYGVAAMGGILLIMALFPSTPVGFGMGFVFGGAFVATFLGGITILQERVHDSLRGRAFALAHSGLRVSAVTLGVLAAWGAKLLGSQERVLGTFRMDGTQIVFMAAGLFLLIGATILLRPAALRSTPAVSAA
ncbi:MAG: MFS transporter [Actinomycetota bacterium]